MKPVRLGRAADPAFLYDVWTLKRRQCGALYSGSSCFENPWMNEWMEEYTVRRLILDNFYTWTQQQQMAFVIFPSLLRLVCFSAASGSSSHFSAVFVVSYVLFLTSFWCSPPFFYLLSVLWNDEDVTWKRFHSDFKGSFQARKFYLRIKCFFSLNKKIFFKRTK